MPRKKYSEKLSLSQVEKPRAVAVSAEPPASVYRSVFCPVCGVSHGRKILEYPSKYFELPVTENFWEWLQKRSEELGYEEEAPFGVIQEVGRGRGHGFKVVGYFGPEDDVDGVFPLVKERLLRVVKNWLQRGWLKREELMEILR